MVRVGGEHTQLYEQGQPRAGTVPPQPFDSKRKHAVAAFLARGGRKYLQKELLDRQLGKQGTES